VTAVADPDGEEAQRFGAATSGHVLLFDPAGELRFSGGITASRGHVGDNDGCDRLIRLLTAGVGAERPSGVGIPAVSRQPLVYGCPIRTSWGGRGK
jgi:hypothetical protein